MTLALGDFEELGQEEGVRETDDVPQRVGLTDGLEEGVPLRHCVTVADPLNDAEGDLDKVVVTLGEKVALGLEETVKVTEEDKQRVGLTDGELEGVTLLH